MNYIGVEVGVEPEEVARMAAVGEARPAAEMAAAAAEAAVEGAWVAAMAAAMAPTATGCSAGGRLAGGVIKLGYVPCGGQRATGGTQGRRTWAWGGEDGRGAVRTGVGR